MRRLGWVLTILGALLVVLGSAVAVVLGPDSRFTTGPHPIDTSGTVVVTQPGVISWRGVQVDVLAEVPVNKPVFVGLGNSVDVRDYVQRTERLEVTDFSTPWDPTIESVDGQEGLPGAPTALDWWISDSAGLGGASISTTLPDETVSLAVVAVGATNLSGLEVTLAYGVKGGFAGGLATVALGAGFVLAGVPLRRGQGLFAETDDEVEMVEEIVYVYVDEHGVEHEISAEEAAALEAEEQADRPEAEDQADPPESENRAEPPRETVAPAEGRAAIPDGRAAASSGVVTAADVLREAGIDPEEVAPVVEVDPGVEEAPRLPDDHPVAPQDGGESTASAPTPAPEKVVYVFVDEDGVEHEVSEDELDDYEILDGDEEDPS